MLITMQQKVNEECIHTLKQVNALLTQGRKAEAKVLKTDVIVTLRNNKIE
jgi:hypothetical protein